MTWLLVYLGIGTTGWGLSALFIKRDRPWWKELLDVLLWPAAFFGLRF